MSRPLRIEYAGACYHVMNRGAGRQDIFHAKEHYELFLKLLNEIHNRYRIDIHAYCLMKNHYHLLLHTPLANLSRVMRHLNGVYTQRYNQTLKTDGPLFRGRFKAILIDADDYLLRLSRYIHLNPVVAGMVRQAERYIWSSYQAYLGMKSKPGWLTTEATLKSFGSKLQKVKYRAFIEEGVDKELDGFFKKVKRLPILGSDAFIRTVSEKYLKGKNISREIVEQKYLQTIPNVKQVMRVVADHYQIEISSLKTIKQSRSNYPRAVAIYLSYKLTGKSLQCIAAQFNNISYSGVAQVYRRMKDKIEQNSRSAALVVELENKVLAPVDAVSR